MSAQRGQYFDGSSTIVDAHDALQAAAGNATWLNEFLPVLEGPMKHTAEAILWLFYNLGFFLYLLACSITLIISNTTCYLQLVFTLIVPF